MNTIRIHLLDLKEKEKKELLKLGVIEELSNIPSKHVTSDVYVVMEGVHCKGGSYLCFTKDLDKINKHKDILLKNTTFNIKKIDLCYSKYTMYHDDGVHEYIQFSTFNVPNQLKITIYI